MTLILEGCVRDGEPKPHCYCLGARLQHTGYMRNHRCVKCCWCGYEKCIKGREVQKEGHGPLATVIEWEE